MLPKEERGAKGKAASVEDNVRAGPPAGLEKQHLQGFEGAGAVER